MLIPMLLLLHVTAAQNHVGIAEGQTKDPVADENENGYHFGMMLSPLFKTPSIIKFLVAATVLLTVSGCGSDESAQTPIRPQIVVTHSLLGAVVAEVVGESATVSVLIADGTDPHDWEPSAKDIERINNADLVVVNGLSLEAKLEEVLENAVSRGVPVFEATDYITVREISLDEAETTLEPDEHDDEDHDGDPHFWTDAWEMARVVEALGKKFFDLGIDVGDRAGMTAERLVTLDNDLRLQANSLTDAQRVLVTGHESLGYFADRYGFTLVGAVIPSLTTQAEVSAGAISSLKDQVLQAGVTVIFSELGTPSKTVAAIAAETGARVVEVSTHILPEDGSYETFMGNLMRTIVEALKS